ncbi:PREDICTED: transport and Golgi organization protein 6 homolog isoform X2 [Dinoponera quadriceps]|uniref:Transport and Golgi organization protein 6 homolog isoform X2 n=1 Tax=Dinoponera quadriceps TaxID=609295 RepID=A0A6P3WT68_DINQU|nr:PREDICTED: transport and Golgi organization protein 6 homolog isoform X2 [Dinoponera quadriceps]
MCMKTTLYKILSTLTSSDDDRSESFDDKLARKLYETETLITDEMNIKVEDESVRKKYLETLVSVLNNIIKANVTDDIETFSVKQIQSVKIAVGITVSIGIIPCLEQGVGIDMAKLCPRAVKIPQEDLSCMQRYERLKYTTIALTDLFHDNILRPTILLYLGAILAALLQLSFAPLTKPNIESGQTSNTKNCDQAQFRVTVKRYQYLVGQQKEFYIRLISLLSGCPQYKCIQELMVIHGQQKTPKWLRTCTRNILISKVTQPGGVLSLINAICGNELDIGENWPMLDLVSKLLATPHGKNSDEYYRLVCPQILDLLSSDKINHGSTIANCCIVALYNRNPSACHKYIIEAMCTPLTTAEPFVSRSEKETERCITTLAKCFLAEDAKFKHPPSKLILHVATPLFCLYNQARRSPCVLKKHLQQLLLKILEDETKREELYSAFLGYRTSAGFGDYVTSEFGPTGGIEITGLSEDLEYTELADTVHDLVCIAKNLSPGVFTYVLSFLSNINQTDRIEQREILETEDDRMKHVDMQIAACVLLQQLADMSTVREAQAKKPQWLLSFIKSLFTKYTDAKRLGEMEESECELLYLSLMLVKTSVEEEAELQIDLFKDFSMFLKQHVNSRMPKQLKSLINDVVGCVETYGESSKKYYQDLSVNPTESDKFDKAVRDLADPLIPVQANGLMTLRKLIESQDPCTVARRGIVLSLLQTNLKHEDSYIYLASINGLCALATAFPQEVIETLVPEYIDMPNRITGTEVTIETRVKLGEMLVKTTRALGDMGVVHKNLLVNGFLCAVRDKEPLVRASALSCLGELCKVLGFRLGNVLSEIVYCIAIIVKSDKAPECRRAAVLVATLLFRGLGKDTLTSLGGELINLYRGLKHLRDEDNDPVLQLHAQLALEEIDLIVQDFLSKPSKLEKQIFVLDRPL